MGDTESKSFSEGRPLHRRGFFSEGLRGLLRPIADILEQRLEDFNASLPLEDEELAAELSPSPRLPLTAPSPPISYLRPPGALPEDEFLARCVACGHCAQACPVSAIRLVWTADARRNGKPAIEPAVQACVLCEDLSCTKVCPSGALRPLARSGIRIGLAALEPEKCLRSTGEDCRVCVDKCPVGERAIRLSREGACVEVHEEGCVGCGLCEMVCPAQPRAVRVRPREG